MGSQPQEQQLSRTAESKTGEAIKKGTVKCHLSLPSPSTLLRLLPQRKTPSPTTCGQATARSTPRPPVVTEEHGARITATVQGKYSHGKTCPKPPAEGAKWREPTAAEVELGQQKRGRPKKAAEAATPPPPEEGAAFGEPALGQPVVQRTRRTHVGWTQAGIRSVAGQERRGRP